ncbi:LOW QUALITY PROTEIN: Reverse transcriptase [Phytophthora palmivora]|uniref:Reverse transcriptase n=1 Tax=Phytophthora palmivora TaxID=4796 RepID=A0A2P4YML0_9STRA|nr:LOW QUALITY PROTEIN: Reverse transcriptase [Phytophthora palmivora]
MAMTLVLLIAPVQGQDTRDMEKPNSSVMARDGFAEGNYGLTQTPRIWYQTLHAYLEELGFTRCADGVALYIKYVGGRNVLVTVYVDAMTIISKSSDIDAVVEALRLKFIMKGPGCMRYLLSMEIH